MSAFIVLTKNIRLDDYKKKCEKAISNYNTPEQQTEWDPTEGQAQQIGIQAVLDTCSWHTRMMLAGAVSIVSGFFGGVVHLGIKLFS